MPCCIGTALVHIRRYDRNVIHRTAAIRIAVYDQLSERYPFEHQIFVGSARALSRGGVIVDNTDFGAVSLVASLGVADLANRVMLNIPFLFVRSVLTAGAAESYTFAAQVSVQGRAKDYVMKNVSAHDTFPSGT